VPIVGGNTNPSQIRNISTTKYDKTIVGEIREFYVPYSLFADDGADLPYRFITAVQMLFTLDDAFWILVCYSVIFHLTDYCIAVERRNL
jgi:hypothetical protein